MFRGYIFTTNMENNQNNQFHSIFSLTGKYLKNVREISFAHIAKKKNYNTKTILLKDKRIATAALKSNKLSYLKIKDIQRPALNDKRN